MSDAILPKPDRSATILLRRLLPDVKFVCICGAPLFYRDEPHDCNPSLTKGNV